MKRILLIGEILVEVMADNKGKGFRYPQPLTGPFPSGAPAIFASQVAKLGQPVAIVSSVGNDDFGDLNLHRLKRDGVDISGVRVDTDRPTGSAFVRYRADGSRDFVFNIKHSACGQHEFSERSAIHIEMADHIHIMGSSFLSQDFVSHNLSAAKSIKARGGTVSFDPNLRSEILAVPGVRQSMLDVLHMTDLFLPSGEELTALTEAVDESEAVGEIMNRGVGAIVHKQGMAGASYFDAHNVIKLPAFKVEEHDPTGAGDCFGGAFTAYWLRGTPPERALLYGLAAGALAVTRTGPMEGACDQVQIENFLHETQ